MAGGRAAGGEGGEQALTDSGEHSDGPSVVGSKQGNGNYYARPSIFCICTAQDTQKSTVRCFPNLCIDFGVPFGFADESAELLVEVRLPFKVRTFTVATHGVGHACSCSYEAQQTGITRIASVPVVCRIHFFFLFRGFIPCIPLPMTLPTETETAAGNENQTPRGTHLNRSRQARS